MRCVSFQFLLPYAVVACLWAMAGPAGAVTIDMVTVGNPGNAGDTRAGANTLGKGSVGDSYQIGKYDVTIGQYTAFLNAADPTGTNPNGIYNSQMQSNLNIAGISYNAVASNGSKYSVINNGGDSSNRPITYVSWFDAARFANWMANGQGSGSTENGAYDLATAPGGTAPAKNLINPNTGAAPTSTSRRRTSGTKLPITHRITVELAFPATTPTPRRATRPQATKSGTQRVRRTTHPGVSFP